MQEELIKDWGDKIYLEVEEAIEKATILGVQSLNWEIPQKVLLQGNLAPKIDLLNQLAKSRDLQIKWDIPSGITTKGQVISQSRVVIKPKDPEKSRICDIRNLVLSSITEKIDKDASISILDDSCPSFSIFGELPWEDHKKLHLVVETITEELGENNISSEYTIKSRYSRKIAQYEVIFTVLAPPKKPETVEMRQLVTSRGKELASMIAWAEERSLGIDILFSLRREKSYKDKGFLVLQSGDDYYRVRVGEWVIKNGNKIIGVITDKVKQEIYGT